MKSLLVIALLSIFPFQGFAICNDGQVGILVLLSHATSDKAYENGEAPLGAGDLVRVYEYKSGELFHLENLKHGYLTDDTSGNYSLTASADSSHTAPKISFYHDHETWNEDGLSGQYTSKSGKKYDLSSLICHWDELFILHDLHREPPTKPWDSKEGDKEESLSAQAQRYKNLIKNETYVSESDYTWEPFYSTDTIYGNLSTEASKHFLANIFNQRLQKIYSESGEEDFSMADIRISVRGHQRVEEMFNYYTDPDVGHDSETISLYRDLKEELLKDFSEFKGLYFIKVYVSDSATVAVFLLGHTAEGFLVGLQTVGIET